MGALPSAVASHGTGRAEDGVASRSQDDPQPFGVLFVHGIGDQERGETLSAWAGALTRFLRAWTSERGADLDRIDLCELPADGEDGSQTATLSIRADRSAAGGRDDDAGSQEGERDEPCWYLRESWWAQLVTPPPVGELGSWLARIVPFLVIAQVWPHVRWNVTRLARVSPVELPRRVVVTAGYLVLLGLSILAAALLPLLIWLLLLLLRVPLPGWTGRLEGFVKAVASTLGDSYLLVQDPLQYDRMRARVKADLEWLSARCERIVVVAHSQGAALARDVLADVGSAAHGDRELAKHIWGFASVGSGIWKLTRLRSLLFGLRRGVTLAPAWGLALILAAVVAWLLNGRVWPAGVPLLAVAAMVATGVALLVWGFWKTFKTVATMVAAAKQAGSERPLWEAVPFALAAHGFADDFRWVDYWATADPVPNGPLIDADGRNRIEPDGRHLPISQKVHNFGSPLADHSAYVQNYDQFWLLLAGQLFAADGSRDWEDQRAGAAVRIAPPTGPGRPQPLAWRQRRLRVHWLVFSRTAVAATALLSLVTAPSLRTQLGAAVLGACSKAALLPADLVEACTAAPATPEVAWYARQVALAAAQPATVGSVALALGALLAYVLLRALWRSWQRRADEVVVHQRQAAGMGAPGWAVVVAGGVVTFSAMAAAWSVPGRPLPWLAVAAWVLVYFALQLGTSRELWQRTSTATMRSGRTHRSLGRAPSAGPSGRGDLSGEAVPLAGTRRGSA